MLGAARWLGRRGLKASPAQKAMWRSYAGLTEPATRAAFIATVRAVIDQRGQRVSALERLYLAQSMPTLLLWGEGDRIIPVSHARSAHAEMPGSRLEVISGAGHFVQLEKPAARVGADPRLPRHHHAGGHHRPGHARGDAKAPPPAPLTAAAAVSQCWIVPVAIASKALPGTAFNWFRSVSFHRGSVAPLMNQLLPLSATIIP